MKLFILLIFITTILINCINGQFGTYVQMIPYLDSTCSDISSGVGYSFSTNQCYALNTIEYGNVYIKVEPDSTNSNATISHYKSTDKQCSTSISNSLTVTNGTCIQVPNYTSNELTISTNYVLISIVENPSPPNFHGFTQTVFGDPECEVEFFYFYYTNGTVFNDGNESSMFYCNIVKPYEQQCTGGKSCHTTDLFSGCSRDYLHWSEDSYIEKSC